MERRKQMLVEERWKVEGGRWGWNPGGEVGGRWKEEGWEVKNGGRRDGKWGRGGKDDCRF